MDLPVVARRLNLPRLVSIAREQMRIRSEFDRRNSK